MIIANEKPDQGKLTPGGALRTKRPTQWRNQVILGQWRAPRLRQKKGKPSTIGDREERDQLRCKFLEKKNETGGKNGAEKPYGTL